MITQILKPSPPFRRRPFKNRADFFSLDRRWGAARQMAHYEELAVFPSVFCSCVSFSFVFARKVDRIVPLSTTGSGAGFCLFCRNLRGLPVVSFQQLFVFVRQDQMDSPATPEDRGLRLLLADHSVRMFSLQPTMVGAVLCGLLYALIKLNGFL